MKRKIFPFMLTLVVTILITSTVFAGAIKFGNVNFSLGSLVAQGTLKGLGNQDVEIVLDASGDPVVSCTNQGGNQTPGQNPPKVSAAGQQQLSEDGLVNKNGTSSFDVETVEPQDLDPVEYGCANDNWTAEIEFIFWTDATIAVMDVNTGQVLLSQDYACTTTLTAVTCVPKN